MTDFITVTVVTGKLKKEIKDRLIKGNKKSFSDEASLYEDLGIAPPEEVTNSGSFLDIKKEDYDIIENEAKIRPEMIKFVVDNDDIGSTLYVATDFTISVKETAKEIEDKINKFKNGVK